MSQSFFPSQIGFIPTGSAGVVKTSSLYLGRDPSLAWEAVGFGLQGRPDYLQTLVINLTKLQAGVPTIVGTLTLNVQDLQDIITANANATTPALNMKLRQVSVCDAGVAKKMMIIASSTYL